MLNSHGKTQKGSTTMAFRGKQKTNKQKNNNFKFAVIKINKTIIAWQIIAWETNYEKEADVQAD